MFKLFKTNISVYMIVLLFVIMSFSGCVPYDDYTNVATSSTVIIDEDSIILKEMIVHKGGVLVSDSEYGYKKVKYSLDDFKDSCIELDYKNILRQPKNYEKEHIKLNGEIKTIKKLSVSNSNYIYEVETPFGICNITDDRLDKDIRLLKGDKVTIYGVFEDVKVDLDEETNIVSDESLNITAYIVEFIDQEMSKYKQEEINETVLQETK